MFGHHHSAAAIPFCGAPQPGKSQACMIIIHGPWDYGPCKKNVVMELYRMALIVGDAPSLLTFLSKRRLL